MVEVNLLKSIVGEDAYTLRPARLRVYAGYENVVCVELHRAFIAAPHPIRHLSQPFAVCLPELPEKLTDRAKMAIECSSDPAENAAREIDGMQIAMLGEESFSVFGEDVDLICAPLDVLPNPRAQRKEVCLGVDFGEICEGEAPVKLIDYMQEMQRRQCNAPTEY